MTGAASRRSPGPRALALGVWAVTFGYAAISALLIQLVLLPYVVPAWHKGGGLLVGGDWLEFHNYAVMFAERIRTQGWSAFELRPVEQAPIGIASAIYALTWSRPWTLIPLNAALHATAAALLFRLLSGFVADWRWAALGVAPFVFYPSALMWVSQIHKDGFFIAGYFCLFVAWAELARHDPAVSRWSGLGWPLVLLLPGFGLVWLVRPELTRMAHGAAGLAVGVVAARIAFWIWRNPRRWERGAAVLGLVVVATVASVWLTSGSVRPRGSAQPAGSQERSDAAVRLAAFVPPWADLRRGVRAIPWYRSSRLPLAVDRTAYEIALTRETFIVNYLASRSNMDVEVGFYRATDVFRYLPRALQVSLLAPFPTEWGEKGSLAWTSVGRRVVAVEMLGVYPALVALLVVAWRWRRRADLWIIVLPCLAILGLYGLAVPNLGALHRFRYGFLMTLVGVSLTGGLDLLGRHWRRGGRVPATVDRIDEADAPGMT